MRQDCHYCGTRPRNALAHKGLRKRTKIINGIDRIDNHQGYVYGNVVTCCAQCNYAKGCLSYADFIQWAGRVYRKWLDRGGNRQ